MTLALECRGGMGGVNWPDGRALLDQPVKLIYAFNAVYDAAERFRAKGQPPS